MSEQEQYVNGQKAVCEACKQELVWENGFGWLHADGNTYRHPITAINIQKLEEQQPKTHIKIN